MRWCVVAVIGCIDPVVPRGANMTRTGDKAVITCPSTAQIWHIVCQGSVWLGKVDNCTTSNRAFHTVFWICYIASGYSAIGRGKRRCPTSNFWLKEFPHLKFPKDAGGGQ